MWNAISLVHGHDDGSVEPKRYSVDFSINLSFNLDYLVINFSTYCRITILYLLSYIYIYIYICIYNTLGFTHFYTRVSQKFCNMLVFALFWSFNKTSQTFKLEAIMLHGVKSSLCHLFDPTLTPVIALQINDLFHRSFHTLFIVEASRAQVSHLLEQVIIWSEDQTI